MRHQSGRRITLGLAGICFTACLRVGQQQEQPWRLVTLSPLPEQEAAGTTSSPGGVQAAIGIGPIHLPGYLDQDQLVTRISPNRVSLSENDRWAQSLENNMAQVLAHNVSILLRTDRVILHPWPARQRPIYQLEVDVLNFETDSAGTAQLVARWILRDAATGQTIAHKDAHLTATGAGTSTERPVASLSKALGDFSLGIANAIRKLIQPNTKQSALKRKAWSD